jgi:hypothetical protein
VLERAGSEIINVPVGTLDATLERKVTTIERMTSPPCVSIREYGSTAFQSCAGAPVLLKPSTVMNMPEKNTRMEYETCQEKKKPVIYQANIKKKKKKTSPCSGF